MSRHGHQEARKEKYATRRFGGWFGEGKGNFPLGGEQGRSEMKTGKKVDNCRGEARN